MSWDENRSRIRIFWLNTLDSTKRKQVSKTNKQTNKQTSVIYYLLSAAFISNEGYSARHSSYTLEDSRS